MSAAFYMTCFTSLILLLMSFYIITRKKKVLLHYSFLMIIIAIFILSIAIMMQDIFGTTLRRYMFWENMGYFGAAFAPVSLIILGKAYAQPERGLSKKSLLLFIIPIVTIIMLWTNDFHHLFFVQYPESVDKGIQSARLGVYFYVHALYSYVCLLTGFVYLSYFAVRNSGIWSAQAILIIAGSVIPTVVNVCYTLNLPGFNTYSTPVAFTATVFLYLLGMFRFRLLKVTPIALQTVINRISDSFVVVDADLNVIDYNKPFVDGFHFFTALRKGENLYTILSGQGSPFDAGQIRGLILDTFKKNIIITKDIEITVDGDKRYYTVEFTPIYLRGRVIGVILLFKDITQHIKDMEKIQENQAILLEKERLASLGQMIGGIAHNLKTPIMSLAGGIDQLQWLAKEYAASIGDPDVNTDDHKEIAAEMQQWLGKMKTHLAYMSDIISTVKDQATKFNNPEREWFTLDELLKRVKILMNHEIVRNKCVYKQNVLVRSGLRIEGDINSMVQILDNLIANAIQAYGHKGGEIVLKVTSDQNKLTISVSDFATGIDERVKDKLFKEMVTTKGKHGTGLGLYMSYSTIKGKFRGNMWFESKPGKGTRFYIQLPIQESKMAAEAGRYA